MHRMFPPRITAGLAALVALTFLTAGCTSPHSERPRATGTSERPDLPPDFCAVVTSALPDTWLRVGKALDEVGDEVVSDPRRPDGSERSASSVSCSLRTGRETDTRTTAVVTWKTRREAPGEAFGYLRGWECDWVRVAASDEGVAMEITKHRCQATDDAKKPSWTELAMADKYYTGVLVVRVDTNDPEHRGSLPADARRLASATIDELEAAVVR